MTPRGHHEERSDEVVPCPKVLSGIQGYERKQDLDAGLRITGMTVMECYQDDAKSGVIPARLKQESRGMEGEKTWMSAERLPA